MSLKKRVIDLNMGFTLNLIWCEPGVAILGAPPEIANRKLSYPEHPVKFEKGFWIGDTPITTGMGAYVLGKKFWDKDDIPLISLVTWYGALDFCKKLTDKALKERQIGEHEVFSLPTEYQWEYACRANTRTRWFFGDNPDDLAKYAWYKDNSDDEIHPVKLKSPNPWMLYDMYGNVPEWCLNCVNPDLSEDGLSDKFAAIRGGIYYHNLENLSTGYRERLTMQKDNPFVQEVSFRVVLI